MEMINKKFPSSSDYTIREAMSNDLADILELMHHNFHFEETIFNALCLKEKITHDERKIIETILDNGVEEALNNSPCLVAIHNESKKIIGVNLMTISKNPKYNNTDESTEYFTSNTKSVLVNQYFHYLSEINKKADLFIVYPDKKMILEFYAIAVDKNYRRMGISKNLIKSGIILAQGIPNVSLVFGIFTSLYSMKSAEKSGMHILMETDLMDYKNSDNEVIFDKTKPHNIVYVMVLQI